MIRIVVGGTIGIVMSVERLLIAVAHTPTPLPSSRLTLITIAAIAGLLVMLHGLKYPRRYEG